jgi:hypothetical protein
VKRLLEVPSERLDVQRLRVLPVDPVADVAQPREIAQGAAPRRTLLVTCEIGPRRAGAFLIRRYIAWRNRHAQDRMLREVVKRANVA